MTTYVVTLKTTGVEVYRYGDSAPVEWQGMEFATHDHTEVPDQIVAVQVAKTVREFTPIEFMRRFTPAERIAARVARKTDMILDDFYALLEQAPVIHTNDPDVIAGLGYMTQHGLIAVGRASEILNG